MANSVWLGPFGFVNNGSQIVFPLPGAFPDGTSAAPSIVMASQLTTGWYTAGSNTMSFASAGARQFLMGGVTFRWRSDLVAGWASTTNPDAVATDTGLSRTAAATLAVGNGTQGDVSGTVAATTYTSGASVGVATFGPAAVASITVKGGIVTAIS